jgi:hypothetical protein
MNRTLSSEAAADLEVGDTVRLTELVESVPVGTQGRVVGFYRLDPPQTLVAFEHGNRSVLDCMLERVA